MAGFDPEFQPGHIRAVLEAIDQQIATVEANVLEGRCKTLEDYRSQLGIRTGLHIARKIQVQRLDAETMQRLGLKP